MPLVKAVLESSIKSTLESDFGSAPFKESLRKLLMPSGTKTNATNIDQTLTNISILTKVLAFGTSNAPGIGIAASKKIVANEWSNSLSDAICEWMKKEIAPAIAAAVATEVDAFVKSGTVNVTTTGVTVGAPAPHAITAQPGVGSVI